MQLRRYQSSDCKKITELFYQTVHTTNAKDYSKEQLSVWAPKEKDLTNWNNSLQKHFTIVAIEENRIIGFGDISINGYLDHLYVHPHFQGRYIASKICTQLEQFVQCPIVTYASITSKGFFEHRGYRMICKNQVIRKGISLINYRMEKEYNNQI